MCLVWSGLVWSGLVWSGESLRTATTNQPTNYPQKKPFQIFSINGWSLALGNLELCNSSENCKEDFILLTI